MFHDGTPPWSTEASRRGSLEHHCNRSEKHKMTSRRSVHTKAHGRHAFSARNKTPARKIREVSNAAKARRGKRHSASDCRSTHAGEEHLFTASHRTTCLGGA